MICYDLDGVLRLLADEAYGEEPPEWYYEKEGKDLFDFIELYPNVLIEAPETEIAAWLRKNQKHITIITNQLEWWKPYTMEWINNHFPHNDIRLIYATPLEKIKYINLTSDYLIEDNPHLAVHNRIIIYDRKYNRNVKSNYRIKNLQEFLEIKNRLEGSKDGKRI